MKTLQAILTVGATLIFSASSVVLAESGAPAAYQSCIACHGVEGRGNLALNAPALAGQDEAYLARQLSHFKAGIRGSEAGDTLGQQMKAMAMPLSDEDIAVVSAYLSGLAKPVPDALAGDLKNGQKLYQGNCGACHGAKAEGNPALNAPGLAWLDAPYLKRQYRNFGERLRGAHPDDKYGRQMLLMSKSLSREQELEAVIAYMHSLALE